MGLTGMEVTRQKPLSPGAENASLAINLNESDIVSATGSPKYEKLIVEESAPVRKRIVILPAGLVESDASGLKGNNVNSLVQEDASLSRDVDDNTFKGVDGDDYQAAQ